MTKKLPNTEIRTAQIADLHEIVDIYNQAITEGGFTADLTTFTVNQKESWFQSYNTSQYGIYVVTINNIIVGYFYFSPWRSGREAFQSVAEVSFYISKNYRGRGIGNIILEDAISKAKEKKFETLLAILLDINTRSKSLLVKHGFETVGHIPNIAKLKNTQCGHLFMAKTL